MTEKKKEITERLEREFEVCDKHILRINEALEGLGVSIPMSADCYSNLNAEQVRCIDQFIFRFSKLQDAMGAKYSATSWNTWTKTSKHFLCVTF